MSAAKPIATQRSATGIPTARLAVWWVLASEVVIFGGVLGSYLMFRIGHPWFGLDAAHTQTWIGAFNTFVLLTSSFTAVLAHQAAERGDGKKAAGFLLLTVGGAATFMIVKAFEWTSEITHGYTIQSSNFWGFYYTAAGIHALHVLAGAIIMLFIAWDAFRGRELHRVETIGIYWHFVDVVWIFLFPLLYIAK
ncbi:MAG: cytochrome c oxidase subunit 3 [Gemmatimonadetes bacterium]|nr:cytochrome c oxidase subunit 3 [Gemmatimonadota bacterium]